MELVKLLFENNIYRDSGGNYYCGYCLKSSTAKKVMLVQDQRGVLSDGALEHISEHITLKCPECGHKVIIESGIN